MSFEHEWAGLVSNARSEQSAATRLNSDSAPNDGGGGGGSGGGKQLKVTPHVLRSHAGRADTVSDDFAKADNETMRETGKVPGSMKGFACDEAFADFQKTWRAQMKYLDGLYTGVAKALRAAATTFKAEDIRRKVEMDKKLPSMCKPEDGTAPLLPNSPLMPNSPLAPPSPLTPNAPFAPPSPLLPPQGGEQPLYVPGAPTLPTTSEPKS